jgi:protein SCO1/2
MKRALTTLPFLAAMALFAGASAPARESDPPTSLYRFDAKLDDQSGKAVGLDVHRGHPVLVTMFYGSCPATCPLIIDTLRATERAVAPARRGDLRVLMISIDPRRDTPAALAQLAQTRRIDTARWTLASTDAATVRTLAALLNVQYRELPDGEFSHSTVIALLSPAGEIEARTSLLGAADEALVARLAR